MKFLNDIKISVKVVLMLLLLSILTLTISYVGSNDLKSMSTRYSHLSQVILPDSVSLARMNRRITEMVYAGYRVMNYPGASDKAQDAAAAEKKAYEDGIELLAKVASREPEGKARFDGYRATLDELHALTARAVAFGLRDEKDQEHKLLAQADEVAIGLNKRIKIDNLARIAASDKDTEVLMDASAAAGRTLLVIGVVSVIGGIAVSVLMSRLTITGPLARLQTSMGELAGGNDAAEVLGAERRDEIGSMARAVLVFREAAVAKAANDAARAHAEAARGMVVDTLASELGTLADGKLTGQIAVEFPAEYAALRTNFNAAVAALRDVIGAVTETTASIRSGSNEIARASEDLARRTEGNAASLEETSAAIQQIDMRLKATAEAAERSVSGTQETMVAVGEGRTRTDQAVEAMGRVSESAKGIDSVIEGLDKIAFQTRVLAMNAAVEAGRAGDAGRGFAVVADLVSALAMRAEEEAKRARDQLTVTQSEIGIAVQAVQKIEGALTDISTAGREAATIAQQIAADNQAQASAITQVSTAVGAMDQSTQQNAAMVEQTSAAARNLASEVDALTEQAARFDIGTSPAPARHAAAARPVRNALPAGAGETRSQPARMLAFAGDDAWNEF